VDLSKISQVERVTVRPGDCIIVHLAARDLPTAEAAREARRDVRASLRLPEDVGVLVLGRDDKMRVISGPPENAEGEGWWR
jgi:hypothetical protein